MGATKPERVQFENPPLVEAVCEFRFAEIGVQSVLVSGRYYERVKAEYPEIEVRQGLGVQAGGQQLTMATEQLTVFRNPSAKRLVQVGLGMLAVNQLRPYSNYQTFRAEIERRLVDYREIALPKKLTRLALRYINHIAVADQKNGTAPIQIGFKIPSSLPGKPDPYLLRLEFPYQGGRDRLILITTKVPGPQGGAAVVLDMDYVLVKPDQVENEKLMEWVDTAHDAIENVFHASVTKEALAGFKPVRAERRKA
ncbi:MAG: TIGR04255 family protein [Deltaproteobacteria bacterium]|nr:TIGR04255 family protein [Deltaproteobacteria bacterium]